MNSKTKRNKFFSNGFIIAGILFILAYFFYKEANSYLIKKCDDEFMNKTFNEARKETNEFFAEFYKENNITIDDLKYMDIDQLRKIRSLKRKYCERKKAEGVVQPAINFKEVKGKFDLYRKKTDKEKMRENFVDPKVAGY